MDEQDAVTGAAPAPPRRGRGGMVLVAVIAAVAVAVTAYYLLRPPAPPPGPPQVTPEAQAVIDEVQKHMDEKRYEKGLEVARAYLAKNPETPYIHFTVGFLLAAMQDYTGAIPEFEAELKINPDHIRSLNSLGVAYASLGEMEKAVPYAERSLKLDPDQPRVALVVGRHLASTGRLEEAEKQLLVAVPAGLADAHFELAMLYLRRNERERAVDALRQALALDPEHLAALYNLGQTLKRIGQGEEGDQILAHHVRLTKEYDEIEALALRVEMPGRTAVDFAELAQVHVRFKQYPQAAAAYRRAIAMAPEEPRYLQALASVLVELGELAEADRLARRTLELSPGNPAALFLLGSIRIREGRAAEAQELFKQSRARGDWSGQTYRQLGITFLGTGSPHAAKPVLEHATTLEPENAEGYYWWGLACARSGSVMEAQSALEIATSLAPDDDEYQMALGLVRFIQGDRDGAADAFRRAIHLQRATLFGDENVEKMLKKYAGGPQNEQAIALYRELRGSGSTSAPPAVTAASPPG